MNNLTNKHAGATWNCANVSAAIRRQWKTEESCASMTRWSVSRPSRHILMSDKNKEYLSILHSLLMCVIALFIIFRIITTAVVKCMRKTHNTNFTLLNISTDALGYQARNEPVRMQGSLISCG
jgi:hypothetical protein